ncbi:MAG: hypothetical protein H6925_06400 [Holosporaceae bacterium]|nr:MAG: hypothetical protein H6925_06400 [Holosporaceae bacterium]
MLKDHGFVLEGTDLIIRRILTRAGRNQIFVNDIPLSLNLLNQITPHLIDVHGQFDQILVNQNHIHYLDQFSGIDKSVLSESFLAWKQSEKELRSAEEKETNKEERLIVLRAHIESLQKLNPQNNEEEGLLRKKEAAKSSQKITDLKEKIYALSQEPVKIEKRVREIFSIASALNIKEAEKIKDTSELISANLMDLEAEISTLESLSDGSIDINQIEGRIFSLREAARTHRVETNELPGLLEQFKAEEGALNRNQDQLQKLRKNWEKYKDIFEKEASAIHEKRQASSKKLSAELQKKLQALKLPHACFHVHFARLEAPQWSEHGTYKATFQVSTNPGIKPDDLLKVASGGERSRIMLALKTLINTEKPTLVFDEIDSGLGGEVSASMGDMLKKLSKNMQILSITHSPQLSACADHHFFVQKTVKNEATHTVVTPLTEDQRIKEISRMLSGKTITQAATEAARALLADKASV